ncbi:MAG: phage tail tape measure protein [Nitrincola lacisaponensis]|uniref:phage tail tape measure protein n=1 Tax=Nitrincola lacisaponensis TaxID=267850 RepID=UPI00391A42BD
MARDLRVQLILDTINKASAPLKAITRDGGKTAEALKASQQQLKSLKQQQQDISSFRKLQTATTQSGDALREQQQKAAGLARQLKSTANPTKKLQREFETATLAARKLKTAHQGNQHRLQQLGVQLRESGIGTKNLDRHQNSLNRQIKQANTAIDSQKKKLGELGDQQQRLEAIRARSESVRNNAMSVAGHSAVGLYGGQRALRGMFGMMGDGIEFDSAISELQAVSRLTKDSEELARLRSQARDLGASTAFSATEVAAGQTFLARAGFSTDAITNSMGDMLALAKANGTELARTADIASNIAGAFAIDPETEGAMTRVADLLSGTASRANVNLEMLGETMKYLGGSADLDYTMEQAAAMAGVLGNIGIQGSQAGTTLRAMMNRLTSPAKAGRDAIEAIGLEVTDAEGNLRAMPEILRDINNATQDMGNAERKNILQSIFGAEAGSGMAELVAKMGDGDLDRLLNELNNVQGENLRMAATMADNAAGDIKSLASAWSDVKITLFETNNGPLRATIQSITTMVRGVGNWMNENPKLTGTLIFFAATLATVVTVMGALGLAVSTVMFGWAGLLKMAPMFGIFKTLGTVLFTLGKFALPLVATGIKAVAAALFTNPIGLAVMGIAAAAYLIYRNWEPIKAFFTGLWQQVKEAFSGGIAGVGALLLNWSPLGILYSVIQNGLATLGIELPAKFTDFGSMLMQGLINGITGRIDQVREKITSVGSSISGWFKNILGINSPSLVFTDHGSDVMAGLQQGLGNGESAVMDSIVSIAGRLMEKGRELAGRLRSTLGDLKNSALDRLNTAGGWLRERLGFDQHELQPAGAGGGFQFDNRPALQPRAASARGNSLSIGEIHVHAAPGMDAEAVARMVAIEIQKLQLQQAASTRSQLRDED